MVRKQAELAGGDKTLYTVSKTKDDLKNMGGGPVDKGAKGERISELSAMQNSGSTPVSSVGGALTFEDNRRLTPGCGL